MTFSRIVSSLLLVAVAIVGQGVARADADGHGADVRPAHTRSLPPIVPLEALLIMSTVAGSVGVVLARRGRS